MPPLKIEIANSVIETDGSYTVRYKLENGDVHEMRKLSKQEGERRVERVGHYIDVPN